MIRRHAGAQVCVGTLTEGTSQTHGVEAVVSVGHLGLQCNAQPVSDPFNRLYGWPLRMDAGGCLACTGRAGGRASWTS